MLQPLLFMKMMMVLRTNDRRGHFITLLSNRRLSVKLHWRRQCLVIILRPWPRGRIIIIKWRPRRIVICSIIWWRLIMRL